MGVGSALGDGRQYIPWIHVDDLCSMYIQAIEDENMEGVFNAVTSDHKSNQDFVKAIAKVLKKKLWAPKVPGFLLRILLGEMSQMVLRGNRVSADKIEKTGFRFQFPKLEGALKELLGK